MRKVDLVAPTSCSTAAMPSLARVVGAAAHEGCTFCRGSLAAALTLVDRELEPASELASPAK
jgi:hypothetical protein